MNAAKGGFLVGCRGLRRRAAVRYKGFRGLVGLGLQGAADWWCGLIVLGLLRLEVRGGHG